MIQKDKLSILVANLIILGVFTPIFIARKNYEFLGYIAVIVLIGLLLLYTHKKVFFENGALWGLTVWSLLHLSGGGVYVGGKKLYELILIPISDEYQIFKYDQFVHIWGFGIATYFMYLLIRPLLAPAHGKMISFSIVVVMAGLGVGALNELIEFAATVIAPETGVGGYTNTSLDLLADLIGGLIALGFIIRKERTLSNAPTPHA